MPSKKVVVVIVEGITDQMVFEKFIRKLVKKNGFFLKVINGDLLTNKQLNQNTGYEIIEDIKKLIYKEIKLNHEDIAFIGHVIDTDGIFIPKSSFVVDVENKHTFYGKNYVYDLEKRQVILKDEQSKEKLLNSWSVKRENVKELFDEVRYAYMDIPYKIYYNSLDLEHVISNRIVKDKDKEKEVVKFISSLKNKSHWFKEYFNTMTSTLDYEDSWVDIIGSKNWYEAKSNIRFLIDDINEIENNTQTESIV